jgi:hypothetical protein
LAWLGLAWLGLARLFFLLTPHMKLEQTKLSETSAHKKFISRVSTQNERIQFKSGLNPIESLLF